MWKVEENFPRGGAKKEKADLEEDIPLNEEEAEELFKEVNITYHVPIFSSFLSIVHL